MKDLSISRVLPGMALLCVLISSCNSANTYESADQYAAADSTAYAYDPQSSKTPSAPMVARKAEMNFKVKELQKTSQTISKITSRFGGEVWNSHLRTEIQNTVSKQISSDSILEVITHRQTNDLTIRVPSQNLDSLLEALEGLSQLLHNKEVITENVTLDYLSNELKAKNLARIQEKHENAIDTKKSKVDDYTNATYNTIDMQNDVIDRQIHNLSLQERVNYSTVKVSIYQDDQAYQNVVANLNDDRFGPAFGASAIMALQDGWSFVLSMLIFLIRIWPLYFIVAGIYFLIRYLDKFRSRFSKATLEK